jgi:hypothetical protein
VKFSGIILIGRSSSERRYVMTGVMRKNFLILEGRRLARDGPGMVTPAEWLYLYRSLLQEEPDLLGRQVELLAEYAAEIQERYQIRLESAAV